MSLGLDIVHALLSALARRDATTPCVRELAEASWLVARLATPSATAEPAELEAKAEAEEDDSEMRRWAEPHGDGLSEQSPKGGSAGFGAAHPDGTIGWSAKTLGLPAAPGLEDRLGHARGLAALSTSRVSASRVEIDTVGSIRRSAMVGEVLLTTRRTVQKATQLVLIVDTSPSLAPWEAATLDLMALARSVSGLASVSVIPIDLSAPTTAVDLSPCLRAGLDTLAVLWSDGLAPGFAELGARLSGIPAGTRLAWMHAWPARAWRRTPAGSLAPAKLGPIPVDCVSVPVAVVPFSPAGWAALGAWMHGHRPGRYPVLGFPRAPRRRDAQLPADWSEHLTRLRRAVDPACIRLLGLAAALATERYDIDLLRALAISAGQPDALFLLAEALTTGFLVRCEGAAFRFRDIGARTVARATLDVADLEKVLAVATRAQLPRSPWRPNVDVAIPVRSAGGVAGVRAMLVGETVPSCSSAHPEAPNVFPLSGSPAGSNPASAIVPAMEREPDIDFERLMEKQGVTRMGEREAARTGKVGRIDASNTDETALATWEDAIRLLERDLCSQGERLRPYEPHLSSDDLEANLLRVSWEHDQNLSGRWANFNAWLAERVAPPIAAAWILSLKFVRVLEDRGYVSPRIAGPNAHALHVALNREALFQRNNPGASNREYLLEVFRDLSRHVGAQVVFGLGARVAWALLPSPAAVSEILRWLRLTNDSGQPVHTFTDIDSPFVVDLIETLLPADRQLKGLLETPEFVAKFILDHALDPAIEEQGIGHVRLIDPVCGSGVFLVRAFERILAGWRRTRPLDAHEELVRISLGQVHGIDICPEIVAIARFRLLLAALDATGNLSLDTASPFVVRVVAADSLVPANGTRGFGSPGFEEAALPGWVVSGRFDVVVGNPPFVGEKDPSTREKHRRLYRSAVGSYSLCVPFIERFFGLAAEGGFVGVIASNSFMKREFGRVLVEEVLPELDLTYVVDTSGAHIPGHGIPTVILFGRNRSQVAPTVRLVQGGRAEPKLPTYPAQGQVWGSIVSHGAEVGFQNEYVSVVDAPLDLFHRHPWSLKQGVEGDVKAAMEAASHAALSEMTEDAGVLCATRADDVFVAAPGVLARQGLASQNILGFATGNCVRDWAVTQRDDVAFPYDRQLRAELDPALHRFLWPSRTLLGQRPEFNGTHREGGLKWFEWSRLVRHRMSAPRLITFAFVATHNHFALRGGFLALNSSAPALRLRAEATEDDYFALLGLLNSSLACFWMKQVFVSRGAVIGAMPEDDSERVHFEFDAAKLRGFPIPRLSADDRRLLVELARKLTDAGSALSGTSTFSDALSAAASPAALEAIIGHVKAKRAETRARMVRWQEELDWLCYSLFGFVDAAAAAVDMNRGPLEPEDRPYQCSRAGRRAPDEGDRARQQVATSNVAVSLVEVPGYKRRWHGAAGQHNVDSISDETLLAAALRTWLLDRLEAALQGAGTSTSPAFLNTADLAKTLSGDSAFQAVARAHAGRDDFDLVALVTDLVRSEAVPTLPALRFTETGRRTRAVWEQVWDLQRREDAGESVSIPVPPKYGSTAFRDAVSWRLRGKLDIPMERFNVYPYAARTRELGIWVTWAGLNHLQRAVAVAGAYLERKEQGGWSAEHLTPFLAELDQLLPWLKQWHNGGDAFDTQNWPHLRPF